MPESDPYLILYKSDGTASYYTAYNETSHRYLRKPIFIDCAQLTGVQQDALNKHFSYIIHPVSPINARGMFHAVA